MLDYLNDSSYQIIQVFDFRVSDLFRTSGYRGKAGNNLAGAKDGDYIPSAAGRMRTPANKGNRFQGRVFLLVSHATDSAGAVTAAIFKHGKMGTVIGQETAGRIKFNSDPVAVKLPNSGLQAYIPVAIYTLPGGDPNRGVMPDIIVDYSIEDLKNHTDKEMETVKDLM
jgi:C-terminal processing protease CtpA/Prc